MKKIVAFGHQKNVGKDEVVKFLIDILRPDMRAKRIVRRGFADKLYDACHIMYGWAGFKSREYYSHNPSGKNDKLLTGLTVRETLIKVGNKVRDVYPDTWIEANLRDDGYDLLFVTDLRYPNEFNRIKELGGICIKIVRPGLPEPTDEADTALNGHTGWDLTVHNNSDLGGLWKHAEVIAKEYILK